MNEKENKDNLDLFLPGGYVAPQSKDVVIDKEKGTIEDIKNLSPLEQIKLAANKFNIPINNHPKKNCKHCYGRGYIGFNAQNKEYKEPITCKCMFPPKTEEEKRKTKGMVPLSSLPKKYQRKFFRDKDKALRKELKKASVQRELKRLKERLVKDAEEAGETTANNILSGDTGSPVITANSNESEDKNVREVSQG